MGQKVNPTGIRLGIVKQHTSVWYADGRTYADYLNTDLKVRQYIQDTLKSASVSRVDIQRPAQTARITIHTARPGIVIGKKGEDVEKLRQELTSQMGVPVHINIEEIRKPELDAALVAQSVAQQLERRVMFRRAMKRAVQNAMRIGAKGIKIQVSGRLGGAEIARSEHYHEGTIPLQTLRADIDYGFAEANTTYGKIGIKVWIYKGEVLSEVSRTGERRDDRRGRKPGERRDRRDRRDGDRREGGERRERRDGDRRGGPRRGDRDEGRNINAGARQVRPGYKKPVKAAPVEAAPVEAPVENAAPETTEGGAE